jgi:hypothetical protein
MKIVRDPLFMVGVDVEIFPLPLDLRGIGRGSRRCIEAFIVPGVDPDLPAAIIQLCFQRNHLLPSRVRFPHRHGYGIYDDCTHFVESAGVAGMPVIPWFQY